MKQTTTISGIVRAGLLTAALCAAMVSVVLVASAPRVAAAAGGAPIGPVDVNAPVTSGGQCAPCHARIAEAVRPGIIFTHGSHLLVSCDGCHWGPPHRGGSTLGPTMESCFNCHGVPHGKTSVARGDCPACHTKSFKLRPATHTADWKAKPHAVRAKLGANSCLMCHKAREFCDACHVKDGLHLAPTQPAFRPVLLRQPERSPLTVYPDGQTSMGQCASCHPDLDKFLPGRIIFAHGQHLASAFRCESCHNRFVHGPNETYRPDMQTCYACHGLAHASDAFIATRECSACHPKEFVLRPSDHSAAFVAKDHRVAADRTPEACAMCHEPSFCTACHQGRPAKAGGPARARVIPADHRKRDFRSTHGKTYLKQSGACASCHDATTCLKCHKTPLPHPPDWTSSHSLAPNLDSADCNVCHVDRARCQQCHHQDLRGAELIEANCVRCHPVVKTKPATRIKNKGLAEHAAHFLVAEKKGKPFRCQECHVGFTTTAQTKLISLTQGHDLRLCFECHGALDYQNRLKAPYPGNALCRRCHADLNL